MRDATDVTIVLDRSGSMAPLRTAVLESVNKFLADQRADPSPTSVGLVQFDDRYEVNYLNRPAADAPDLTLETYQPRGGTALLGAVGKTIDELGARLAAVPESDRPSRVVVVVQTDGQENATGGTEWGREYTQEKVLAMVRHQEDRYGWTFVFLGAGIDAIATAARLGIHASNSQSFAQTAAGYNQTFGNVSRAVNRVKCMTAGVSYRGMTTEDAK